MQELQKQIKEHLRDLSGKDLIEAINSLRATIHEYSPFKTEPVDFVKWVSTSEVQANDYNPNSVAPPEMELLALSILSDGYTQPVVAWKVGESFEVVDGFHRNRVCRENPAVRTRVHGYLPLVQIKEDREGRNDRIASTIRHNRARGKHKIDAMSDIVVELKRRNWSDEKICRELGMDQDEVLRLCQITGLAELFTDTDFSKAWDIEGEVTEADFEELSDDVSSYGEEAANFRVVNTNDKQRIFHTYDKWECFKAGFYNTTVEGKTKTACENEYREFLSNTARFSDALEHIIVEWKHSCEHYLTNVAMNRIAWLGQAAACYALGIPSSFRDGFNLLSNEEQTTANNTALIYLNKWLEANNRPTVTIDEAMSYERQSNIY